MARNLISILAFQLVACYLAEGTEDDIPRKSCLDWKPNPNDDSVKSGLYPINSKYDVPYYVYCDMESVGGGWTLVASIHENRIDGKCTFGDRWSSENGPFSRDGESNWENTNTFGRPEYATSDDFKNVGYYELEAKRLMVMQVPNDTPMARYIKSAKFQYYTQSAFLELNGGNLRELFKAHPIRDGYYTHDLDNGPSVDITFIKKDHNQHGSTEDHNQHGSTEAHNQYGTIAQQDTESGYMQFRAISDSGDATAFCPYGKMRPDAENAEYACFGVARAHSSGSYCGDFSYMSYGANPELYNSAFLIFYR